MTTRSQCECLAAAAVISLIVACDRGEAVAEPTRPAVPHVVAPPGPQRNRDTCLPDHVTSREPVPCSHVGAGCGHSDWEHDCSCTCEAYPEGTFWSCTGGTIGSICAPGRPVPPRDVDMVIPFGQTATIHDPTGKPTAWLDFTGRCAASTIVIDRDPGFRSATPQYGGTGARIALSEGTWFYEVRCRIVPDTPAGEIIHMTTKLIAQGQLSVIRDDKDAFIRIEKPADRAPWGNQIEVRVASSNDWSVSIDGIDVRGGVATVPAPTTRALAIKAVHSQHGIHYYLRRPHDSPRP